jgi:cell wall-associated NlpC family hydrolase
MNSPSSTRSKRLAIVLCTTVALCAPMTFVGAQAATPTPKPFEAFSNSAQSIRDSLVQIAKAQLGRRYRTGGQTPEKGFDCSGLVKYIMSALNLDLPRTAKQQAKEGLALTKDTSRLLPGDLLTFGKTKKSPISHIGIYVGDGRYIHASSVAGKVIESAIDRPYSPLIKGWRGARRIVAGEDSIPAIAVIASPPGKGNH